MNHLSLQNPPMDNQFLKDHWLAVKSVLKNRFPNLTSNDLAFVSGRVDEVFGRVEIRTGAKREEIEDFLRQEIKAA